jgi:hypothetical protein
VDDEQQPFEPRARSVKFGSLAELMKEFLG